MSISQSDAEILRANGFSEKEIESYANARTPTGQPQPPIDINGATWQAAIKTRREWVNDLINRGWTTDRILQEIDAYYVRDSKRNPYDFLKAEYRAPAKIDYTQGIRNRAKAQARNLYKNNGGR